MTAGNPYASPFSSPEPPPQGVSWYTEGVAVYARHGAILPAVELETGEEGDQLVATFRRFTKVSWKNFSGIPVFLLIQQLGRRWEKYWLIILIAGFTSVIAAAVYRRFKPASMPAGRFRIQVFRNRDRKRKETVQKVIVIIGMIISIGLMISAFPIYSQTGSTAVVFLLILIAGLAGVIASGIYSYIKRPKVHLTAGPDGWVRLGNVHPSATRRLREIETEG